MRVPKSKILLLALALAAGTVAVLVIPARKRGCPIVRDDLKLVSEAFAEYRSRHGEYPVFQNFQAMVSNDSELIKDNLLPLGIRGLDQWGRPYSGSSTRLYFKLESLPDPSDPKNFPGCVYEPSGLTLRSSRTPPALSSALSQLFAISAPLIVSAQAWPLSFFR